jgi:hypothetical protein
MTDGVVSEYCQIEKTSSQIVNTYCEFACYVEPIIDELALNRSNWCDRADSQYVTRKVRVLLVESTKKLDNKSKITCEVLLLAKCLCCIGQNLFPLKLPSDVVMKSVEALFRILEDLEQFEKYKPLDLMQKHLRVVLGVTVPNGAQELDLGSSIPFYSACLSSVRQNSVKPVCQYWELNAWGRWYRMHTNASYLDEFSQAGWIEFYKRTAALLGKNLVIRGVVGTSWFFDPVIAEISPRLSYLAEVPINGRAYRFKNSSSSLDIERATLTSPTRLQMFKKGTYIPTSYSILWGREAIIDWAKAIN